MMTALRLMDEELDSLFAEEFELCNGKAHLDTGFKYDELRQTKYSRYVLESWMNEDEELELPEFDGAKKLVKKCLKNFGSFLICQ